MRRWMLERGAFVVRWAMLLEIHLAPRQETNIRAISADAIAKVLGPWPSCAPRLA